MIIVLVPTPYIDATVLVPLPYVDRLDTIVLVPLPYVDTTRHNCTRTTTVRRHDCTRTSGELVLDTGGGPERRVALHLRDLVERVGEEVANLGRLVVHDLDVGPPVQPRLVTRHTHMYM